MSNNTERFSNRVESYTQYRPGYPEGLIERLIQRTGINEKSRIADIGSGTGIFTQLLLQHSFCVTALEPNTAMRMAAETALGQHTGFTSIDSTAEDTGLESHSVDLICAAQAFHWFEVTKTRSEFLRILKPGGRIALIWNQRDITKDLQYQYESLLRKHIVEYSQVTHFNFDDSQLANFFQQGTMKIDEFENAQPLDFAGLLGRLQSSSYCPSIESAEYIALSKDLESLFNHYAAHNKIKFEYRTRLVTGTLN